MKNNNINKQPIIAGLDIGTTKTIITVGRRNEYGKIETIAYGKADSKGMNEAEVVNIIDVAASIKTALQRCYESNKGAFYNAETKEYAGISEVIVGIAGRHISCKQEKVSINRPHTDNEITFEEIEEYRKKQYDNYVLPGDKIINVIPKNYKIDNRHVVNDPVGCGGRKVDVVYHIITGNQEEIAKICKAVEKAGLKIGELYLQPLASARAVLDDSYKKGGVVVVDIGGGTTDMAVFQDGCLAHTSVINFAGNFITRNIYNTLKVFRIEEAEDLKIQFGSCLPDMVRQGAFVNLRREKGAPESRISLSALSHNIYDSAKLIIQHINANLRDHQIDTAQMRGGLVVTGGSSLLSHLIPLIAHETCLEAQIGHPNEHLAAGYDESLAKPENATCYGLILYGFELYDNQLVQLAKHELIEQEEQQEEELKETSAENQSPLVSEQQIQVTTNIATTPSLTKTERSHKSSIFDFFTKISDTVKGEFNETDEKF